MTDPDIAVLACTARRARRLPPDAACDACGIKRHLRVRAGRVLCYACRRRLTGAGPTERDHVAGRLNMGGLLVDLRPNDHRTVTDLRLRMGIDAWPLADGDPLRTLAHVLAGIASLLFLYAEWLLELATDAQIRLGPAGWEGAPVGPVEA
jgi:hypothetical protein